MLFVSELEGSIVLLFLFILRHSLENTQPTYHKHGSLSQDIFQRKEKKAKFPYNTMKEGRLTISLTRMLCLSCHKFSAMLSNRNWTYVEVTTI